MFARICFDSLEDRLTQRQVRRSKPAVDRRWNARRLLLEGLEDRQLLAFDLATNYSLASDPQVVVTADFNNDGRMDLATADFAASNVNVRLGNSDGTFQPALNSPTGTQPHSLAVGDFNADGKLDLASGNASNVSVLLGNGNGTFGAPVHTNIGTSPMSVAVGDFNGDGKLDLGVASRTYYPPQPGGYYGGGSYGFHESRANVLLGNGTGTLTFASSIGTGGHVNSFPFENLIPTFTAAVADFNGDGRTDFVATNSLSSNATVLLANANGSLAHVNGVIVGLNSLAVMTRDISGDGKADIVASNSGGVAVALGNGLGAFGVAQNYSLGGTPLSLEAGDFNGDGKIDLLTADGGAGTVGVLLGTGAGSFNPPVHSAANAYPVVVASGDFNQDGRVDVVATGSSLNASVLSVLLNNGIWLPVSSPSLSINDLTVTEGNSGTVSANFTVNLSAVHTQSVTVSYATFDGSATVAGNDFQAKSGTLMFAPGVTSQTVTVLINGDRIGESTESFSVRLSESTNAFVVDALGIATILDDETRISIADYQALEGNSGTTPFHFLVTLSAAYDVPVTVAYATADLFIEEQWAYGPTATAGIDYIATVGTLTIPAGQISGTISVPVFGDRVAEGYDGYELFSVKLTNASGAEISDSQAFGVILDDEPFVSISGGGEVLEGNSGTKAVSFTISLSAATDADVTVSYSTADGTAAAGSDYVAATGTVTIPAGQLSQTLTVSVKGDTVVESDEVFFVNLTDANGGMVSGFGAWATIRNDDTAPTFSIGDATVVEGNSGTKLMTFTITLSQAVNNQLRVNYSTANGTAKTNDNDYVAKSGTVTFSSGQTTKTITITIKGDKKKESDEKFYVNLSGASGAGIADGQGIGTIVNDDGSGKQNGAKESFSASAVDAAMEDWMFSTRKKKSR